MSASSETLVRLAAQEHRAFLELETRRARLQMTAMTNIVISVSLGLCGSNLIEASGLGV